MIFLRSIQNESIKVDSELLPAEGACKRLESAS